MVTKVNPPPQVKMPDKILNDPELRGYFTYQQELLFKLWVRTGGGGDSLAGLTSRVNDNEHLLAGNDADIGKIRAVNSDQTDLINTLFDLAQVDRQNIADLISDNGKLRALAVNLQRDASNAGQMLAGLE